MSFSINIPDFTQFVPKCTVLLRSFDFYLWQPKSWNFLAAGLRSSKTDRGSCTSLLFRKSSFFSTPVLGMGRSSPIVEDSLWCCYVYIMCRCEKSRMRWMIRGWRPTDFDRANRKGGYQSICSSDHHRGVVSPQLFVRITHASGFVCRKSSSGNLCIVQRRKGWLSIRTNFLNS